MSPRFESGREIRVAGLRNFYRKAGDTKIPEQWQRLAGYLGRIPEQAGRVAYGLCFLKAGGFDYLSGVEMGAGGKLPDGFSEARIAAGRYAVFTHAGHVSQLHLTVGAAEQWLAHSSYRLADHPNGAPDFYERYGEKFDPVTGLGDVEVWTAVEEKR